MTSTKKTDKFGDLGKDVEKYIKVKPPKSDKKSKNEQDTDSKNID